MGMMAERESPSQAEGLHGARMKQFIHIDTARRQALRVMISQEGIERPAVALAEAVAPEIVAHQPSCPGQIVLDERHRDLGGRRVAKKVLGHRLGPGEGLLQSARKPRMQLDKRATDTKD